MAAIIFLIVIAYFWKTIFLNLTFVTQDLNLFYYPIVAKISLMFKNGDLWFWNPWLFGGFPFLANISYGLFYPLNWICALMSVKNFLVFDLVLHCSLGGIFMYIFMRSIKQARVSSLLSAIIFMFAGTSFLNNIGGTTTKHTEIWLPLVLFLVEQRIRLKKEYLTVILGFVLAIQFFAGHTFTSVLIFACFIYYYFFRSFFEIQENGKKHLLNLLRGFLLALVISVGIWAVQLLPAIELSKLSFRGAGLSEKELFYPGGSLSALSFIQFLIPDFFGTERMSTMWSMQGWATTGIFGYIGLLPIFLIFFSFRKPICKYQVIFLALAIFILIISTSQGNIIYKFFIRVVPFLSMLRGPARSMYLYCFSLAVLSGIAFTKLLQIRLPNQNMLRLGKMLIGISIVIVIITGIYFANSRVIKNKICMYITKNIIAKPSHQYSAEEYFSRLYRIYDASGRVALRTAFILFLVGIWFAGCMQRRVFRVSLGISAGVILCLEFFMVKGPFIRYCSAEIYSHEPAVISCIKNDDSFYRVLPLVNTMPPNILMIYNIPNIKGLDEVYSKYYREYFDGMDTGVNNNDLSANASHELSNVRENESIDDYQINKIALLNVKYVLSSTLIGQQKDWKLLCATQEKQNSFPFFVTNSSQARYFSRQDSFMPTTFAQSNTIYVYQYLGKLSMVRTCLDLNPIDSTSLEHSNDKIRLLFNMDFSEDVFLSEIFYPGWKAYLNNKPIKIDRFDLIFIRLKAEKGVNNLELRYEETSFKKGKIITIVTIILSLVLFMLSLNTSTLLN